MSGKARFGCALVLIGLGPVLAQAADPPALAPPAAMPTNAAMAGQNLLSEPMSGSTPLPAPTLLEESTGSALPSASELASPSGSPGAMNSASAPSSGSPAAPVGLSSWITYSRPDCCGPIGGDGPIQIELYLESGPTFTFGGSPLAKLLQSDVGWDVQGGGRSLFFDADLSAAWVVDLGLNYVYNQSNNAPKIIEFVGGTSSTGQTIPPRPRQVTLKRVHRTFADVELGRDWYLVGPADACGWCWRVGVDGGGRLGTARADFAEIRHFTDTIYGAVVGAHTELEKQWGCCTYSVGLRAEWDYTWMDLLKTTGSDVADVNLLLTLGVRF